MRREEGGVIRINGRSSDVSRSAGLEIMEGWRREEAGRVGGGKEGERD